MHNYEFRHAFSNPEFFQFSIFNFLEFPVFFWSYLGVCSEVAGEGGLVGEAEFVAYLLYCHLGVLPKQIFALYYYIACNPFACAYACGLPYNPAKVFWRQT